MYKLKSEPRDDTPAPSILHYIDFFTIPHGYDERAAPVFGPYNSDAHQLPSEIHAQLRQIPYLVIARARAR